MAQKIHLIATILNELIFAKNTTWEPPQLGGNISIPFPPQLWLGDGRAIEATDKAITAISQYACILSDNDQSLKAAFKNKELESLLNQAFALTLAEIDLEQQTDEALNEIRHNVDTRFYGFTAGSKTAVDLMIGCQLLVGEGIYPIKIGPVIFEERLQWLICAQKAGRVSAISARRLQAEWLGQKQRKRKASRDYFNEKGIRDSVSDYPIICTVQTSGLSSNNIQEKGMLAAKLAMTALTLMWQAPSKTLEWMRLQYDGESYLRHSVRFGQGISAGSSITRSGLPIGKSVEPEWVKQYKLYNAEFAQIGEALSAFAKPDLPTSRPTLLNALFLSLWWYHQACKETSDQMATTKFAASMDALTGGHNAKGIIKLIGARFGHGPNDALMKDGRTTRKVVDAIYNAGRSQLIHGSSTNYSHDWTKLRATAETLGRLCLLFASRWMAEHPGSDDLDSMSLP